MSLAYPPNPLSPYVSTMEKYFCNFKRCGGTEVPTCTHQHHRRKDRLAVLVATYDVGWLPIPPPPAPCAPLCPIHAAVQILPSFTEVPPSTQLPSPLNVGLNGFAPDSLEPSLDELSLAYEQELTGGCSIPELAGVSLDESEEAVEDKDKIKEDQTMHPPPDEHPAPRLSSMANIGAFCLCQTVTADPRYQGENNVDPFYVPPQLH
jgi:hypothetical protein